MYYLNYFFIFSILGHFIEGFFYSSGESGILIGYWTPIYGIGVIIMLVVYKLLNKLNLSKYIKIILLFFTCSIILSLTEILGGYLIKWLFHKIMWDYSNHKFNIGIYTSLEMAFIWGISSIVFIYLIKPFVDKFIYRIPKLITYILTFLFIVDNVVTLLIK